MRDAVFTELTYHAAYDPQRAVRTSRWKYVRRFGDHDLPVLPNIDDGESKDAWIAAGAADAPRPREALYDLAARPAARRSTCAGDPACADVLDDLRGRLGRWMEETDDPLPAGDVPAPAGAELNTADQRSADDVTVRA